MEEIGKAWRRCTPASAGRDWSEPGLAVVEVAACEDQTALAVQELLAARGCTASRCSRRAQPAGDHRRRPALRPRCHRAISCAPGRVGSPWRWRRTSHDAVGERREAPVPPVVPGVRALA
ncbi:DUF6207 family protein [Streptomyces sp. NPDC005181]|uniref:DUF6207 family protein n=1 Tax=Streptomyces sp. NPDC005181 TaxID=3156869 RepID=UPI0033AB7E31